MDALTGLVWLRMGFGVVALVLAARFIFTGAAYRSWRTYLYFGLTAAAFAVLVGLRLGGAEAAWAPLVDLFFVLGIIGALFETWQSDRRRLRDLQRLMDQRRHMTVLAEMRLRELEMLAAVNRELAASLDLDHVLQVVVNKALEFGAADGVTIFVREAENGALTDYHISAALTERLRQFPAPRLGGLTHTVAESGEAVFIADTTRHPRFAGDADPELKALASLPLKVNATVVGVMNVGYLRPFLFEDATMRLLNALADAAALAVHNADQHERLRRQAVTDELTGLTNRRRFLELLRGEMARARRYGHPLSLLMVDLDHLKQINDQNGHAAGDAMLRGIAQCLRASLRGTDVPARLGGDEFAVLMPETAREAACLIAERIRAAVEQFRAAVDGKEIFSTVSIGVMSRAVGQLQDLPSFIHKADEALYHSKSGGRNRVTIWDEMESNSVSPIDSPVNSE